MKKVGIVISILFLIFVNSFRNLKATGYENAYVINHLNSEIYIEKDTGLTVAETVNINFPTPRHGIYRIIPVFYSYKGKTINARLKVLNITNEKGDPIRYEKSRIGQSIQLKIGDPDITLTGVQTYIIKYKVDRIIQRYDTHDELYWNVTGHEWDTEIIESNLYISSPYANFERAECFAGRFGTTSDSCVINFWENEAGAKTSTVLEIGDDFTLVLGLTKDNNLVFPSKVQEIKYFLFDNWGYLIAVFPISLMFFLWYRKGRDLRYISENIYFEPDDKGQRTVKLFERTHIPFVYHPIAKITPGEAGTIIDEKVHISDIVSEILELARLGFIKIRKIETKKLFGKDIEYAFIKSDKFDDKKEREKLKDYQEYLLNELFRSTIIHKSIGNAEKLFKGNDEKLAEVRKQLIDKDYVLLSGVKNHFYEGLPIFKEKLYKRMESEKIFDGNPEKTRGKWMVLFILMDFVSGFFVFSFINMTANYIPLIVFIFLSVPGILIALAMPRRTPKGYSFYRQIQGLKYYLGKGAWRHEIAEKNLFIEEVLPLAVAFGVVDKISKDMSELGIKPPSYFAGTSTGSFSKDLAAFNTASSTSFISAPPGKSGSSSWSGGSGFSGGGSSGGGFGGGGGGSW